MSNVVSRPSARWRNPHAVSYSAAVADFVAGRDTPLAFLERCLARIAERDGAVKAFVCLNAGALDAARAATERYRAGRPLSPVDGCPVGIKDIMDTADMPTQMGSPVYAGWQPSYDAACVQALRAGGAVLVGKTATTAFACGGPTVTTNPWDAGRTPGGSSSGSGAAVGAGMLPVALGTQTQGSTLRPASYCGAYGFKPTHGLLDMRGVHPISLTHDHMGVIAGSLVDTWRIASHLSLWQGAPAAVPLTGAGPDLPAAVQPRRLLRLHTKAWDSELTPEARAAFEACIARVQAAGVEIVSRDSDPALAQLEADLDGWFADRSLEITAYEMRWPYEQYVERHGALIEQRVHDRMRAARAMTAAHYAELLAEKRAMKQRVLDVLGSADGFITLSSAGPAPRGLHHTGSRSFLTQATFLGFPAFSLPLLTVDGMPLGVQLIGRPHADGALCALSAWLESYITD